MAQQPIVDITTQRRQRLLGPPPGGKLGEGGVLLDAVLDESVDLSASVTAFPVELGADINDHVILEPARYIMRGVVTDTPTDWASTEYPHGQGATRSLSAWAILEAIWQRGEPFSIFTGWRTYDSMVIQRIRSRKNASLGKVVDFEAELMELRIVETRVRQLSPEELQEGQARAGMAEKDDQGAVEKEEVPWHHRPSATGQLADAGVDAVEAVVSAIFP